MASGLQAHGVEPAAAHHVASLPPVSSLFAAVLGINPIGHLLAANGVLASLSASSRAVLTGREFFPDLISGPFNDGLFIVFATAAVLALVAAVASLLRGDHRHGLAARPAPSSLPANPQIPIEE
jgi:hypothetical protein